jgi:hypothetical protein
VVGLGGEKKNTERTGNANVQCLMRTGSPKYETMVSLKRAVFSNLI